ncbi:hypothetical protein CMUS01_07807 [Colletotrichum musicola]|uniref:Uncharacterized protein n=1 Tax=Colletotrichum musicola TaxID=2175873 RepID=A0A8H6KFW2_9PEZI|nr:hypothetical protein CMUS01_07807 [Colletotrichum musicola]
MSQGKWEPGDIGDGGGGGGGGGREEEKGRDVESAFHPTQVQAGVLGQSSFPPLPVDVMCHIAGGSRSSHREVRPGLHLPSRTSSTIIDTIGAIATANGHRQHHQHQEFPGDRTNARTYDRISSSSPLPSIKQYKPESITTRRSTIHAARVLMSRLLNDEGRAGRRPVALRIGEADRVQSA